MRLPKDATPEERQIWNLLTRPEREEPTFDYYAHFDDPLDISILMWRGELGYPVNSLAKVLKMTRFGLYKRWVKIVKRLTPYAKSKHLIKQ